MSHLWLLIPLLKSILSDALLSAPSLLGFIIRCFLSATLLSAPSLHGLVVRAILTAMRDLLQSLDNFIHSGVLRQRTHSLRNLPVDIKCLDYKHHLRPEHSHLPLVLTVHLLQSILEPSHFIMQCYPLLFKQLPKLFIRLSQVAYLLFICLCSVLYLLDSLHQFAALLFLTFQWLFTFLEHQIQICFLLRLGLKFFFQVTDFSYESLVFNVALFILFFESLDPVHSPSKIWHICKPFVLPSFLWLHQSALSHGTYQVLTQLLQPFQHLHLILKLHNLLINLVSHVSQLLTHIHIIRPWKHFIQLLHSLVVCLYLLLLCLVFLVQLECNCYDQLCLRH